MNVKREDIENGHVEAMLIEAERQGLMRRMPPAERQVSKRRILAELGPGADVWVFAYGSLMWNPCIHYAEQRPALIHGYHRSFCLWMPLGRGSPERPGLTLALEPGGSCRGLVFRIAAQAAERELDIIWNREMLTGAYRPRLIDARTPNGPVRAVAFVVNRDYPRYAGRLAPEQVAQTIAVAEGRLGTCAQYLFDTVAHLGMLGIEDGPMHRLKRQVEIRQAARDRARPG